MIGQRLVTILTGALLICPVSLLAQELEPGQRIRVTAPEVLTEREVGQLLWLDADSLVLEDAGAPAPRRWVIPPEALARIEVSQGRRGNGRRGLMIGAGVGFFAGFLGLGDRGACADDYSSFCAAIVTGSTLSGGLLGLVIGAALRTEHWAAIPLS